MSGQVPSARAQEASVHEVVAGTPTPWRAVSHHAMLRGSAAAFVVGGATRTWREVADATEQAAAGLVRSGLRADQIVLSLLPVEHPYPELDVALRCVGAVVIHVGAEVDVAHLADELGTGGARLVVAEDARDLSRLEGLDLTRTELFTLEAGVGWRRLLALGAERLRMDPDLLTRLESANDPRAVAPRVVSAGTSLARVADPVAGLMSDLADALVVVAGEASEAMVHAVREAHLQVGFALCQTSAASLVSTVAALAAPAPGARRRGWRRATEHPDGPEVVVPAAGGDVVRLRSALARTSAVVQAIEVPALLAADLPLPPPVLVGDPTLLPRRFRGTRSEEFDLRLADVIAIDTVRPVEAAAPDPDAEPEAEESAFSLPSLPLMNGESVLDRLLRARAGQSPD